MNDPISPHMLDFYTTQLLPCPYLASLQERKLLTELGGDGPAATYDLLARHGFRRSHNYAYRPFCPGCSACLPVRVQVADFRPTRSMRRVLSRNRGLRAEVLPPVATDEQFGVFSRYVRSRHGDGEMSEMDHAQYRAMLEDTTVRTALVEFRDERGQLVAALMSDRLADGLSAVYSFFEPDRSPTSPGTWMVLWAIAKAHALGLPYMYLGYFIHGCRKMDYKVRFGPLQAMGPAGWIAMESGSTS